MRKAAGLVAAIMLASGCGASGPDSESAQSSDHGTTSANPVRSDRGNIVKELGEISTLGDCDEERCVQFSVTSISKPDSCESPLDPIEGQLLNVAVEIETSPSMPEELQTGLFQTYNWAVVTGDGITKNNGNGAIMTPCNADPDAIGGQLSPGSKYEGTLQFDVPADSEILVLDALGYDSWEWQIPETESATPSDAAEFN